MASVMTWASLIFMAALAAITVIGIAFGMRRKRTRLAAEERVTERREAAGVPEQPAPDAPVEAPAVDAEQRQRGEDSAQPAPRPDADTVAPTPSVEGESKPAEVSAATSHEQVAEPTVEAIDPAEPTPAATPLVPPPAAPMPSSIAAASIDDITQLKGLGPKLAAALAELGYTRIDQIAALTAEDALALDVKLGAFQGRMARDRWIEQARLLAAGDRAGYEAQFGKLG